MHNKRLMLIVFVISSLVPFSGCLKYYKLAKSEFPQGKDHADKRTVVANNVRTERIYHEFSTKAIFSTLWLSDEARSSYVDMFCEKRGKDAQTKEAMLARQLEENKHWISFYVLADIRDRTHVSLTDLYPMWSMYLDVHGGEKVQPISIKEAEVNPEYQFIFGHRFNMFKRAYMVKFPATSLNGDAYLSKDSRFRLVFSSVYKEEGVKYGKGWKEEKAREAFKKSGKKGKFVVKKNKKEKMLKDDDFYWL